MRRHQETKASPRAERRVCLVLFHGKVHERRPDELLARQWLPKECQDVRLFFVDKDAGVEPDITLDVERDLLTLLPRTFDGVLFVGAPYRLLFPARSTAICVEL